MWPCCINKSGLVLPILSNHSQIRGYNQNFIKPEQLFVDVEIFIQKRRFKVKQIRK